VAHDFVEESGIERGKKLYPIRTRGFRGRKKKKGNGKDDYLDQEKDRRFRQHQLQGINDEAWKQTAHGDGGGFG